MTEQQMTKQQSDNAAANIAAEASTDAGFQKMLKFNKGEYICEGQQIPLGTQYIAHCIGWTKMWVHFVDKKVVERKIYRVSLREKPPERDELPDNDNTTWPKDPNGRPIDPWALQYLLPMEHPRTGEVQIFVASSFGGRRAIADLCTQWGNKASKDVSIGQPIIKLAKTMMPTKNWGDVPRPMFELVGWEGQSSAGKSVSVDVKSLERDKGQDMNDEIPF